MSHRSVQCGGENCPLMDLSKANLNFPHLQREHPFMNIFQILDIQTFWIYSKIFDILNIKYWYWFDIWYSIFLEKFKHSLPKANITLNIIHSKSVYFQMKTWRKLQFVCRTITFENKFWFFLILDKILAKGKS